jgi:hypothetical protein
MADKCSHYTTYHSGGCDDKACGRIITMPHHYHHTTTVDAGSLPSLRSTTTTTASTPTTTVTTPTPTRASRQVAANGPFRMQCRPMVIFFCSFLVFHELTNCFLSFLGSKIVATTGDDTTRTCPRPPNPLLPVQTGCEVLMEKRDAARPQRGDANQVSTQLPP